MNTATATRTIANRRLLNLLAVGTSALALVTAQEALAECDDNRPGSGDEVVCDANTPNPDTDGVRGATSDDVVLTIEENAGIDVTTAGRAILLGDRADIRMRSGSFARRTDRGGSAVQVGADSTIDLDNATISYVVSDPDFVGQTALVAGVGSTITLRNGSAIESDEATLRILPSGSADTAPTSIRLSEGSQIVSRDGDDAGIDASDIDNVTVDLRSGSSIQTDGPAAAIAVRDGATILLDDARTFYTGSDNFINLGGIIARDNVAITISNGSSTREIDAGNDADILVDRSSVERALRVASGAISLMNESRIGNVEFRGGSQSVSVSLSIDATSSVEGTVGTVGDFGSVRVRSLGDVVEGYSFFGSNGGIFDIFIGGTSGLIGFDNIENGEITLEIGSEATVENDGLLLRFGDLPDTEATVIVAGSLRSDGDILQNFQTDQNFVVLPTASVDGVIDAETSTNETFNQFTLRAGAGENGSYDFTRSPIGGFDEIVKDGEGSFTLTGTGRYFGDRDIDSSANFLTLSVVPEILVNEGLLRLVDADLDVAPVIVGPDGSFAAFGDSVFGDLTVQGAADLSPGEDGDPIGVLRIGNLVLNGSSTVVIDANDAGEADRIVVTGTIDLGGATLDVVEAGEFAGDDPFRFIIIDNDAADAVNGTFGTIENDFAFLEAMVSYSAGDGNDVELSLAPTGPPPPPPTPTPPPTPPTPPPPPTSGPGLFPMAATTFNQTNSAIRLDELDRTNGDANDVYMALLFATTPEALTAFDSASGEIYASLLAGTAERGIERGQRLIARSVQPGGEGLALWGGALGRTGSVDGDGNAADIDQDRLGLELGVDYRGQDNGWAAGASVAWLTGDLDIADRASEADYDGWSFGGYTRYGTAHRGLTVSAAIDYTAMEADVTRRITVNTLNRTASGVADYDSISLSGEVRYGLGSGDGEWAFGPVGSIFHADAEFDGVDEIGAGALSLSGGEQDFDLTRYGGGLFAGWRSETASFDLSAQYLFGSDAFAEVGLALDGSAGVTRPVRSPLVDGDAARITASATTQLGGGWSLSGEARATLGSDQQNVAGSISVGLEF